MGGLERFERRLESMISGAFARTFRSAVQPVEIAAALERELDNNAQILSRDRRLVPNDFHVELAPTDLQRLAPYDSTLARELSQTLQEHAQAQSYVFPGPVKIDFEPATDLTTGRFRIRSAAQAEVSGSATPTQVGRAQAVLEINGTQHPLTPPGVVIGRGSDADIRINDPGISRRHAEFLVTAGRDGQPPQVEVHDLGSTNGLLVDGRKVPRATLREGTEVRAGTTVIRLRIVDAGPIAGGWSGV
ncbi:FhaA domain-containing protein [Nocardioides sp.]|uniref:FhaA domain-containing protein n=1 Tax=Nocardioides sp. TaxID=35761 RepID=UPI0035140D96